MILSDRDLRERLLRGDLVVGPLEDPELQIQPASIDLRLDKSFVAFRASRLPCLDPRDIPDDATERIEVPAGESFVLHPGDFVLGSTIERVRIPSDLVARVEGRSSCLCAEAH